MAITVSNLRIAPYTQKDVYKPIFGDALTFAVTLPTPHADGDRYALGCDYERVVFPPARPLCAYTEEFSVAGETVTMSLLFATARFRDWVSSLKKPMPIYLQMVRLRGDTQETLLLDDILALPSVVDGQNVVCEGDPLQELLDKKQDKPAQDGSAGQVLGLGNDGEPRWLHVGVRDIQADWDESDSDSPAYILNKPDIDPGGDYAPASILLSSPPTSATPATAVGQFAIDTANHKVYSCEAITNTGTEAEPVYEYAWREHVLLDEDGFVPESQLNKAMGNSGKYGVVKLGATNQSGLYVTSSNQLYISPANNAIIDSRASGYGRPIVPSYLNYAVRSVLPNVTVIPATSTAYSLLDASATTNNHSWQYTHMPDAASTYTFPAVTGTAVAHRIKLTIDFTNVQTYSFVDADGDAIVPLFTPTIAAGDVYEFRCEYSTVQSRWLIYPCKQGAVADDFVMRGEVGAANGVAGLDGNGLVPSAELPVATSGSLGTVKINSVYGITIINDTLRTVRASVQEIAARSSENKPIVPSTINYAVTAALTDAHRIGVDAPLTDAQKANACDSLGAALQPIVASGAPTTATVGAVGQLYVDTAGGAAYICISAEGGSYTWVPIATA